MTIKTIDFVIKLEKERKGEMMFVSCLSFMQNVIDILNTLLKIGRNVRIDAN